MSSSIGGPHYFLKQRPSLNSVWPGWLPSKLWNCLSLSPELGIQIRAAISGFHGGVGDQISSLHIFTTNTISTYLASPPPNSGPLEEYEVLVTIEPSLSTLYLRGTGKNCYASFYAMCVHLKQFSSVLDEWGGYLESTILFTSLFKLLCCFTM